MGPETSYGGSSFHSKLANKKVPYLTGLQIVYILNILQQSRSSLKKEVKIEPIIEILLGHNT